MLVDIEMHKPSYYDDIDAVKKANTLNLIDDNTQKKCQEYKARPPILRQYVDVVGRKSDYDCEDTCN